MMSSPPKNSRTPAIPITLIRLSTWLPPSTPKSFCAPCSVKRKPATIRSALWVNSLKPAWSVLNIVWSPPEGVDHSVRREERGQRNAGGGDGAKAAPNAAAAAAASSPGARLRRASRLDSPKRRVSISTDPKSGKPFDPDYAMVGVAGGPDCTPAARSFRRPPNPRTAHAAPAARSPRPTP